GGDLVAGLPCRVYFQARTTLDRPADVQGNIVDADGRVVVRDIHTISDGNEPGVNRGLGAFTFTPEPGKRYELKITAPTGINGAYPLPDVKSDGVVLSVPAGVTTDREPIRAVVSNGRMTRRLLVAAYCRGRLLDHRTVEVRAGKSAEVTL